MAAVAATITEVEIITEFLEGVGQEMKDDLDANDRNATGKTKASIQVKEVTRTGGKLMGAEHISYTFGGRGPGKMPPLSSIVDWCNARGIPRSRAYVIARKIRDEGTRLYRAGARSDNALLNATRQERIDTFLSDLNRYYQANAKSDFDFIINR